MTDRVSRRRLLSSRVRVRVTAAAFTVSVLGAAVGSTLFVGGLHESLEQALLESSRQEVAAIAARLESGDTPEQATVTAKKDIIVQIVDRQGTVTATDHPRVTTPLRTRAGNNEGAHVATLKDTYAVHARRLDTGQLIVVGLSEEQLVRATGVATDLLLLAVPLGALMVGGVVWLAIGRALQPVDTMRREAAAITSTHSQERLAVPIGDDEIPRLAQTLNEMLERIDDAQRHQRQFVSNASHELRSPLAIIRQRLELARRYPRDTSVTELAEGIWEEEQRMEALVRSLLTLARLDDRESAARQRVDLDDVVFVELERSRAVAGPIRVDSARVSAGQVYGDSVLLSQMIANLLSNAIRHAHTTVQVGLGERGDHVELVVEDDGNGIAPADRELVFDRFARLDEARAREAGGTGLGLAIVHKIVESAGGTVRVDEADLGGARFVVILPATASGEGGPRDQRQDPFLSGR